MRINELKHFPIRVKLNNNFKLEESFEPNTIIRINSCVLDETWGDSASFILNVTALKSDLEHNKSVSVKDWKNSTTGKFDIDIFDHFKSNFDVNGDFHDTIFVMSDEDCFDIVDDKNTLRYTDEDMLMVIKEITPSLIQHLNEETVYDFVKKIKENKND